MDKDDMRFEGKSIIELQNEAQTIHFACLGYLCEPLGSVESKYNPKIATLNRTKVTCEKCISILKEQNLL